MIATQPAEVIPITDHVSHIIPAFFAGTKPNMVLVPKSPGRYQFPDCSIGNSFVSFDIIFLMAALCSGNNIQTDSLRFFATGNDGAYSNRINSYWFFHENMFVLQNCFFKMFRPELWRCSQNNYIHISQRHQFFVSVKSGEAIFSRNFHFKLCKTLPAIINFILKNIGQSNNVQIWSAAYKIQSSTGPPVADSY